MTPQTIVLNNVTLTAEPYVVKKGPKPGSTYLRADLSKLSFSDRVAVFGEDRITNLLQRFLNTRMINIMDESTDESTGQLDLDKWNAFANNLLSAATGETKAQLVERLDELDAEMNDFIEQFNPANEADVNKLRDFAKQKRELNEAIDAKARSRAKKDETAPTVA